MTRYAAGAIVAFLAGAIASVTGFGIGSILTPFLGITIGIKLAVAAVTIPHLCGTLFRFWTLRQKLDKEVLGTFGVMSAVGAIAGALLHVYTQSPALKILLAALLISAGVMGVAGLSDRLRFGRRSAWAAGGVSGLLGGMIGNQGGIRAAAMLAFDVPKEAFVATATAIALVVDGVRLPVYLLHEGRDMLRVWPLIAVTSAAVLVGTIAGRMLLGRIPEKLFRRLVAGLILILGVAMLVT